MIGFPSPLGASHTLFELIVCAETTYWRTAMIARCSRFTELCRQLNPLRGRRAPAAKRFFLAA